MRPGAGPCYRIPLDDGAGRRHLPGRAGPARPRRAARGGAARPGDRRRGGRQPVHRAPRAAAGRRRKHPGTSCRPRPTPPTTSSAGPALYAGRCSWARDWCAQGYVGQPAAARATAASAAWSWQGDAPDAYDRRARAGRSSRTGTCRSWPGWSSRGYQVSLLHRLRPALRREPAGGRAAADRRGHDEYWSAEHAPTGCWRFVDRGGNVCFFAGDAGLLRGGVLPDRRPAVLPQDDRRRARGRAASERPGALWHVNDREDWLTMARRGLGRRLVGRPPGAWTPTSRWCRPLGVRRRGHPARGDQRRRRPPR